MSRDSSNAENQPETDDTGENRRTRRRVQVSSSVEVQSTADLMTGAGADVSVGGIYVVAPEPLPVGSLVELEFRLDRVDRRIEVLGEVRWHQEQPLGDETRHGLGLEFVDLSEQDRSALRSYIEGADSGGSAAIEIDEEGEKVHRLDRREEERVPIPSDVELRTMANLTTAAGSDVSVGGIYMIAPEEYPIGEVLDLEFSVEDVDRTFEARGEVKWRQRQPIGDRERYGHGVEFTELDSADRQILEAFVESREPIEPDERFDDLVRSE